MRPTDTVNFSSPGDFLRASDHPSRIGDISRTGECSRVEEMKAKQYNTINTFNGQCNPAKPVLNSYQLILKFLYIQMTLPIRILHKITFLLEIKVINLLSKFY